MSLLSLASLPRFCHPRVSSYDKLPEITQCVEKLCQVFNTDVDATSDESGTSTTLLGVGRVHIL